MKCLGFIATSFLTRHRSLGYSLWLLAPQYSELPVNTLVVNCRVSLLSSVALSVNSFRHTEGIGRNKLTSLVAESCDMQQASLGMHSRNYI